ncbi:MAG: response regulator, partial [Candidatus Omnitrophica bacterium]|nr:response regulator [Candidatus Omnitrophota bacterium]
MDFEVLRGRMVQEQLILRGIKDKRVLYAFAKVERHKFVPPELRESAYADYPLPIGEGQTISQPYIAALMTEYLELTGKEKVLEIGTGSGYQAAILRELTNEVYTIERFASLAKKVQESLESAGYEVHDAHSQESGLKAVDQLKPDLIILDVMMDYITEGFQVSLQLRSPDPKSEYAPYSQ